MNVSRPEVECLVLSYRLVGDIHGIVLPAHAESNRIDRLWQHTCFEAFLKNPEEAGYVELNVAPSTEWASYRFIGQRSGMTSADEVEPDRFESKHKVWSARLPRRLRRSGRFSFEVAWRIPGLAPSRLNLTTVIEETNGRRSYWALAHPDGEPDFHHPDCFILDLPPPAAA